MIFSRRGIYSTPILTQHILKIITLYIYIYYTSPRIINLYIYICKRRTNRRAGRSTQPLRLACAPARAGTCLPCGPCLASRARVPHTPPRSHSRPALQSTVCMELNTTRTLADDGGDRSCGRCFLCRWPNLLSAGHA
jgi:hypothetical protein